MSSPNYRDSVGAVHDLLNFIDTSEICNGNLEKKFLDQLHQRSLTLHGSYGNACALEYHTTSLFWKL